MTEYPILVKRFRGDQALTIVCTTCFAEAVITPDDILNDGLYECPANTERGRTASTEPRCRGHAEMMYDEGDSCPNCAKLGYWTSFDNRSPISGYCSRRCMLQHQYAKGLGVVS